MPLRINLAGAGAEILAASGRGRTPYSRSPLPPALLSKANLYHLPLQQSLTLNETPRTSTTRPWRPYLQQHPTHRQDLVRYLAKIQGTCMCSRTKKSPTGGQVVMAKGRYYAQGTCGPTLAQRAAKLSSMDARIRRSMSIGAFYEIIRRNSSYTCSYRRFRNDHRPFLMSSKRDI